MVVLTVSDQPLTSLALDVVDGCLISCRDLRLGRNRLTTPVATIVRRGTAPPTVVMATIVLAAAPVAAPVTAVVPTAVIVTATNVSAVVMAAMVMATAYIATMIVTATNVDATTSITAVVVTTADIHAAASVTASITTSRDATENGLEAAEYCVQQTGLEIEDRAQQAATAENATAASLAAEDAAQQATAAKNTTQDAALAAEDATKDTGLCAQQARYNATDLAEDPAEESAAGIRIGLNICLSRDLSLTTNVYIGISATSSARTTSCSCCRLVLCTSKCIRRILLGDLRRELCLASSKVIKVKQLAVASTDFIEQGHHYPRSYNSSTGKLSLNSW